MTDIEKIKSALRPGGRRLVPAPADLLSTGSTLLNLAASGHIEGGFAKGGYYFFVGDSNSGKTFIGLTCLAEASINPAFDDYRFIHDDVEGGALMDIERFFGKRVADRLEPPEVGDDGEPIYSSTAESFYYHVDNAIQDGRPFIFIEDSQDSLSSEVEELKFKEGKEAYEKGKVATGSYGDGKAKVHSAKLRKVIKPIQKSGSILIILNQTRDSFDPFVKSSYSGGRALKFYACLQLWSSVKDHIEKQVKGKKRELGVECKVRVKKNRMTGKDRTVIIPILHSHGIDDISSCIQYLISEGVWKGTGRNVIATGLGPEQKGSVEKLVRFIEAEGLEDDLRELVGQTWDDVEEACVVKRKNRYEQEPPK